MSGSAGAKTGIRRARGRKGRLGGCLRRLMMFILLLLILGGGYYYYTQSQWSVEKLTDTVLSTVDTKGTRPVALYFADPQWTRLVSQKSSLPPEPDKARKIRKLVELLIKGPTGNAGAVLPRSARVRQVYMGRDGLAVIDFEPGMDELRSYGAGAEMLSVFAIVHTVTENVEGIESVQILVGGKEQETLAGHVSIAEPLKPRPDLTGGPK